MTCIIKKIKREILHTFREFQLALYLLAKAPINTAIVKMKYRRARAARHRSRWNKLTSLRHARELVAMKGDHKRLFHYADELRRVILELQEDLEKLRPGRYQYVLIRQEQPSLQLLQETDCSSPDLR